MDLNAILFAPEELIINETSIWDTVKFPALSLYTAIPTDFINSRPW